MNAGKAILNPFDVFSSSGELDGKIYLSVICIYVKFEAGRANDKLLEGE